jgi:hypothetical protein
MILPFNEIELQNNTFIREFKQDTDSGDFHWHSDQRR